MPNWRILLASALPTLLLMYLLAEWHGGETGVGLLGVGALLLLPNSKRVKTWLTHAIGPSRVHGFNLASTLTIAFGLAVFSAHFVVPRVEGVVSSRPRGKGNSFYLDVSEGDHQGSILGNTDGPSCDVGSQLVKPAWSTAYTCDGKSVPSASISIYPVLAVEFVICSILTAVALNEMLS
jgi:hypothetical protein